MASFANLSDIISTTIQSRSGTLADSVTENNALLAKLKERGNVKPFSGGNVILQELMYNDASTQNASSYSGYDTIDITPNSPISAAQFDLKQYAAAVSISGLEQLQNAGKEQIIDMLEGRVQVAEAQLMNQISAGVYSDGTGNSGKDITGLAAAISTSPTSGTYGGINRATWSFWRNVAFDATTDGGAGGAGNGSRGGTPGRGGGGRRGHSPHPRPPLGTTAAAAASSLPPSPAPAAAVEDPTTTSAAVAAAAQPRRPPRTPIYSGDRAFDEAEAARRRAHGLCLHCAHRDVAFTLCRFYGPSTRDPSSKALLDPTTPALPLWPA